MIIQSLNRFNSINFDLNCIKVNKIKPRKIKISFYFTQIKMFLSE